MTPKSDHEEDMSMEEILASIRKFVTDNPPEDIQKPRVYKGDLSGAVVVPPAGHEGERAKEEPSFRPAVGRQPSVAPASQAPDVLELRDPLSGQSLPPGSEWRTPAASQRPSQREESVMTLRNPLGSESAGPPAPYPSQSSASDEAAEGIGSTQALAASAHSLSRLAQAAKSASPKKSASSLGDQRGVTLDQLIQDMIRPMIKQWIDTHLPALVEEMVAKEIQRITKHLE